MNAKFEAASIFVKLRDYARAPLFFLFNMEMSGVVYVRATTRDKI